MKRLLAFGRLTGARRTPYAMAPYRYPKKYDMVIYLSTAGAALVVGGMIFFLSKN